MKSWFLEKYPPHKCNQCGAEHSTFPDIHDEDQKFVPFEIIGIVEGAVPTAVMGNGISVNITGLHWGIPGTREPKNNSVIFHN